MNNFLQQLVDRSLSAEPQPIRPRLPGPFEPVTGAAPGSVEAWRWLMAISIRVGWSGPPAWTWPEAAMR